MFIWKWRLKLIRQSLFELHKNCPGSRCHVYTLSYTRSVIKFDNASWFEKEWLVPGGPLRKKNRAKKVKVKRKKRQKKFKRSNPIYQEGSANVMCIHCWPRWGEQIEWKSFQSGQLSAGQCREIIYNDKISGNYCYT